GLGCSSSRANAWQARGPFSSLQPLFPVPFAAVIGDISGDRLAAILLLDRLDLQPHLARFPWLEADVDDLDLAGAARSGLLLQGLVDHRAVSIRVMGTEHLDRLVVLAQLVDQVFRRAGAVTLRRLDGAIVPLGPAVLLESLLRALLLDVEQLIAPRRPPQYGRAIRRPAGP